MGNQQDNTVADELQIEKLSTTICGPCSDNGSEAQEPSNAMTGSSDASLVETSASDIQHSEARSEAQNEVLLSTVDEQLVKNLAIEKAGDALNQTVDKSSQEQLPLPFKKSSFMWKSIESMEEFSRMPQHPNFHPLEQYHKDFREGMAIGLMITFSNLVKSIGKLQITDSRQKFDDILNALVNLEVHGFDVQRLQSCILDMLKVKESQERLIDESSALEALLIQEKREKDRLNAESESIEKTIKEIEQTLSDLYEERSHISELKKESDCRMGKLEMDSRRVEDALSSTNHDFATMVSAIW